MRIELPLVEGTFVKRYKRFFADIALPTGEVITAHCPNTGSLKGCLEPGAPAWLRDTGDTKRKLRHSWQAVEIRGAWVNVDTGLPNRAVAEALRERSIPRAGSIDLAVYDTVRTEVKYGANSRIDVLLEDSRGDAPPCYVEVKNTTLAENGSARFPDAVTERGLKHLDELGTMVEQGARAVQFFFVSRGDVDRFEPAADIDPAYARGLARAHARGVEVVAWRTRVLPTALELDQPIDVHLAGAVLAACGR